MNSMNSMNSASPFQVEQLRMQNVVASLEAIGVFMLCLFLTAFGPSLLLRYVYANQQLMEQPMLLEVLPVVCFAVGVGYFIYAMVGNIMREMKARKMAKEVIEMGMDCGCGCYGDECYTDGHDHDHHHHEMMEMSDESFGAAMKKASAKSKKSRK